MYKLSKSRVLSILAVCLVGVFFAIPNIVTNKDALPKWWQPVNLGLDLQGGSNLLLEVKMDEVLKERKGFTSHALHTQHLEEKRWPRAAIVF